MDKLSPEDAMDAWANKVKPSTVLGDETAEKPNFTVPPKAARPKGAQRTSNETLAASALEVLVGFNTAISMGLMAMMMPQSALGVSSYEPTFREQAYAALLTDPGLCNRILKMASTSGTMGLVLAYVGMGLTVAPTAMSEKNNMKAFLATRKKGKDGNTA